MAQLIELGWIDWICCIGWINQIGWKSWIGEIWEIGWVGWNGTMAWIGSISWIGLNGWKDWFVDVAKLVEMIGWVRWVGLGEIFGMAEIFLFGLVDQVAWICFFIRLNWVESCWIGLNWVELG